MQLPTIGDVITRRRERFKESIREVIAAEGLDPYVIMAEEMGEEFSPTDLAAAAFKLLMGAMPEERADLLAEPEVYEPYEKKRAPDKKQKHGKELPPERGMTRLYIDIGREDRVRPGDIVGAIANEADIPGRSIGAIEIFDRFSLVDVPANLAPHVIKALQTTMIRNHKISVEVAKPSSPKVKNSGKPRRKG